MSNYTSEQIQLINKTTSEFYSTVAESFSETRQHEWEGWRRSLPYVKEGKTLLDLGCGNRRYSRFLKENGLDINVEDIDSYQWDEKVKKLDIIDSLLNNNFNLDSYDVAVCFGVMHHIPSSELRERLLKELTKSKVAIVSFWQFEKDERIFNKAQETTKLAQEKLGIQNLEENDYFLGWKDREDVFRFCHNFTDKEIESLESKYKVVEKFNADSSQALNCYLIIKENHG